MTEKNQILIPRLCFENWNENQEWRKLEIEKFQCIPFNKQLKIASKNIFK